jgi:5-methylcytosine-specific restriction protein A
VYGARWKQLRAAQLWREPLCRHCQEQGRITAATDVDHIEPHKGNLVLFYAPANLQSLCHSCHSAKTAKEDGGFGRARTN